MTKDEEKRVLERQIEDWRREMRHLAAQIAAARSKPVALVMITAQDEEYEGVIPESLVEAALRVDRLGWPEGFDVDILNASGT